MNLFVLAAGMALAGNLLAAEATRFDPHPGSKVRIEGTSNIHDWQMEGKLIGGSIEAGENFPIEPGQAVTPGKVEAKVNVMIPVRSLNSIESDGRPYKTSMDDRMYEAVREPANRRIIYRATELSIKEAPKTKDAPYQMDSKGELVVAGVTNQISMPIQVTPMGDRKLKITGSTSVKMTAFKIDPPKIVLGAIKTGDDVKIMFEWIVQHREPKAAAK